MRRILYLTVIAMLLTGCKREQPSAEEMEHSHGEAVVELTDQQIATIGIATGPVQQRRMSGNIKATGTLKLAPQDRAEVTSLISGITQRILVNEGQPVAKGQTLALVENTEIVALQKDYLIASRQLALSQDACRRQQDMRQQGAGIERNMQLAQAELDMAAATEQGLRLQLQQLGIDPQQVAEGHFANSVPVRSPIAGVVGEMLVSTGSYLESGTVLMRIYDNRALHADINVFETDIARIKVGQKATLQLSDHAATLLTGTVSFITAALDNDSKSASVHISLDPATGITLLPNMFVTAAIHQDEQLCNAVPDEAIVMNANRRYVFVNLGQGRFSRQEVITGISQQGYTQITFIDQPTPTDGMAEPIDIVVSKAFYLQSMLADHDHD